MILNDNIINNNKGTYGAGAIYNRNNAIMNLNNNTLNNNTAEYGSGGAINNDEANMNLTNNTLNNNIVLSSWGSGGAIYNSRTNMTLTDNTFNNNTANNGGSIYNQEVIMALNYNTLINNNAKNGGAIYTKENDDHFHMDPNYNTLNNNTLNNNILNNNIAENGGAIYNCANMTLTDNTLNNNTANSGGAIYNSNSATITLTNNTFRHNTANNTGGVITNSGTINKIENTEFSDNTPSNFIIEDNKIILNLTDGFITIGNFTIKIDDTEYNGYGPENLSTCNIPSDSENVKLILNGTDTIAENNIFLLRSSYEMFVTITDDGKINVTITDENGDLVQYVPVNVIDSEGNIIAQSVTDENGNTILNPKDNYGELYVIIPGNKDSTPVVVMPENPEINATTTDDSKINVTITDENGDPIPNVPVYITDGEGNVIAEGVTDENGNTIIDPEDYKGGLNVITPGNSGNNDTIPVVVMPENPEINAITWSDSNVSVTIEEDDGTPLAYVPVNVTDSEGNVIGSGVTDENGNAIIEIGDYTDKLYVITPRNNGRTETTDVIALPSPTINMTTDEIVLVETTNLTAEFYTLDGLVVPDGKAFFRVNDKTLRDNQGKVIYVDVINGKTVLENVNITGEWTKPDTTIQAVYFGNEDIDSIFTRKIRVNVTKPEAVIIITSELKATVGQNVTLTAKVTSGNAVVNSGRVAFKLNGKTLKDGTGKALYANIIDGFATTNYTIPVKTKANTYKLTAVFTDIKYDRVEVTEDYVIGKT